MNKKTSPYLPRKILDKFSSLTGISKANISAILGKKRDISKQAALKLGEASLELGYDFTPSDWMFNPEAIKQTLTNPSNEEAA